MMDNREEEDVYIGLACPPLEDYAFTTLYHHVPDLNLDPHLLFGEEENYFKQDYNTYKKPATHHHAPDINLDPYLFFGEEENYFKQDYNTNKKPAIIKYRKKPAIIKYKGKGKDLTTVLQVLRPDVQVVTKADAGLEATDQRGKILNKTTLHLPVAKARPKIKIVVKKQINVVMQKNKLIETSRPEIPMLMNSQELELKLESTKKRLRDAYDQVNNHKKQKTTRLIDFKELPPMPNTNMKNKAKSKLKGRTTKKLVCLSTWKN